jgi:hypothetical protein
MRRKKKENFLRKAGAYVRKVNTPRAQTQRSQDRLNATWNGRHGFGELTDQIEFEEKKKRKLEAAGIAAGGATMSAGYYKAARDRDLGRNYTEARKSKRSALKKKIPDFKDENERILSNTEEQMSGKKPQTTNATRKAERRKMLSEWEVEQAKNHGVISEHTNGKVKGIRGKMVANAVGKPTATPSKLSQGLQFLTGGRAKLPKVLLRRNPFR